MRVNPRASCIPKAEDVERHSNAARVLLTVYSTLIPSYTIDQNRLVITIRYRHISLCMCADATLSSSLHPWSP